MKKVVVFLAIVASISGVMFVKDAVASTICSHPIQPAVSLQKAGH